MPRKLRLLLDVDGVIADFPQYYLDVVQAKFGVAHSVESITQWNIGEAIGLHPDRRDIVREALQEPGVAMSLRAYPKSIKAVRKLQKMTDVFFVTSPLGSPTWPYDRERWLKAHLHMGEDPRVTHTHDKYICNGDLFIDDKMEHIKAWKKHNPLGHAVLWAQPWNKTWTMSGPTPDIRTNDWNYVLDWVERMSPRVG
jgi:5'(3')-deoxyribonucleotidase